MFAVGEMLCFGDIPGRDCSPPFLEQQQTRELAGATEGSVTLIVGSSPFRMSAVQFNCLQNVKIVSIAPIVKEILPGKTKKLNEDFVVLLFVKYSQTKKKKLI